MVTIQSIKKAHREIRVWREQNPRASLGQNLKRTAQYVKEAYEMDIRPSRMPSVIVPLPRRAADKLEQVLRKK